MFKNHREDITKWTQLGYQPNESEIDEIFAADSSAITHS